MNVEVWYNAIHEQEEVVDIQGQIIATIKMDSEIYKLTCIKKNVFSLEIKDKAFQV